MVSAVLPAQRRGISRARFFWEQHFERFTTASLAHGQPFWFYVPVLAAALMPWTPLLMLLARRALYGDARRRFLLLWLLFVLVFFSFSKNKLPGYLLPLAPAGRGLDGDRIGGNQASALGAARRGALPDRHTGCPAGAAAGAGGGPFARAPARIPVDLAAAGSAGAGAFIGWSGKAAARLRWRPWPWRLTAGVVALKLIDLPAIDRAYSARPLWREIAARARPRVRCTTCTGAGATD